MSGNELVKYEDIQNRIYTIRGVQAMLDEDLAHLYGVETRALNQAVRRNRERFPEEFMFQLTENERNILKSQTVISSWGGRRTIPYVFTEQGIAILSAVLRSETAVKISVQITKAFVAMRRFIAANALIFQRLDTLEIKQLETDKKINHVLNAIENRDIQPRQGIFFDEQKNLYKSPMVDGKIVYHFGASLKDPGKKWFAFSKMDIGAVEMLTRLEGMKA